MMKKIILATTLIFAINVAVSQNNGESVGGKDRKTQNMVNSFRGQSSVGIKLGFVVGVSYEFFMTNRSSIEADVEYDFESKGITVMPLYKYHFPLGANFLMNVGAGVNLSWYNLNYNPRFVFGIDPTVGVDYIFNRASIGIYYRPQLNISAPSNWANVGVRFGFVI